MRLYGQPGTRIARGSERRAHMAGTPACVARALDTEIGLILTPSVSVCVDVLMHRKICFDVDIPIRSVTCTANIGDLVFWFAQHSVRWPSTLHSRNR